MMHVQGLLGLIMFLAIAWLFSENRKEVRVKTALSGVIVQLSIAGILLYIPFFKKFFLLLNNIVLALEDATKAGTSFVFGYIGGGTPPFLLQDPGANFILAFQALPLVLVIGALSGLLFYWRILPYIVKGFSFLLQKTMNIGGALGLGASTTIFLGMVEAPLVIKPYLRVMTRSEIFSLMTVGMACIAGTVMILYATILKGVIPDPLGHILVASFIHVAAAVTIARIMIPETGNETAGVLIPQQTAKSSMDAVVKGTFDGLHLLLNIIAMLVVMVALVHLANRLIGLLPDVAGAPLTLQRLLGFLMAPVVWLFGIPWAEAQTAGSLMGTKTILNELLAFLDMAKLPVDALDSRSRLIMTYALSSFANFGSLGILIGGLGSLAPERRDEIVGLGIRALVAGTLATCMTGAVIGIFS
ncbi:MAG TPA: nucleoside transporter C-terminal domain-containing protein [Nitrospirota bacterium]|nr:nucleoside transporter C-terminal domain-containing protein [Nitrospirota bacterium]